MPESLSSSKDLEKDEREWTARLQQVEAERDTAAADIPLLTKELVALCERLSIAREALEEIDGTYDQHGMGSPEASILWSIAVKVLARLQAKEGNVVKIEDHLIDPQAHGQPGHVPSVGCPECLRGLQAKEEGSDEDEVRRSMRPGDKLYRSWFVQAEEWREVAKEEGT